MSEPWARDLYARMALEKPISSTRMPPVHGTDGPRSDPRCLGPIDRRRGISFEEFHREYVQGSRPVILLDAISDWPALEKWSWSFFRQNHGARTVACGRCFDQSWRTTIGEYIEYAEQYRAGHEREPGGEAPIYMEGWYFRREEPELDRDWSMPAVCDNDWLEYLPGKLDPKSTSVLIGPKGCFTKLHHDLMGTHSWNAQVMGAKRWLLASPDYFGDVYGETRQGPGYYPGTDLDRPDLARYPNLAKVRYYEGVVGRGEVMFFPARWLHQVTTLEDSISLKHNYVCGNNALSYARKYLLHRLGWGNL